MIHYIHYLQFSAPLILAHLNFTNKKKLNKPFRCQTVITLFYITGPRSVSGPTPVLFDRRTLLVSALSSNDIEL